MEPACLRESPAGSREHLTENRREDRTDEDREADGESEETEKERKSVDCSVFGKQTDEELDPRIQEELERLNEASEEINKMELELQEVRTSHRRIMGESVLKLKAMSSDLGSCIEKARPYYEARRKAKEAQQETQKAALSFERAVSMHSAAREMVHVAEQGLTAIRSLDPTWQEMLNHATLKVNEAEEERIKSEVEHMRVTQQCQEAEASVQELQKTLRRSIIKSKSYFELNAQFNDILEELKSKILLLEKNISKAKLNYSSSLRQLEQISEEIHAQRELNQSNDESSKTCGGRSSPLGAEASADTEGGVTAGHHRANDWSDGKVAVANTREWVEMHCNSLSIKSSHTIMSDLEKCDSVEHLAHLSSDISLTKEEHEEEESLGQKIDISEDFLKKHNRSVSL